MASYNDEFKNSMARTSFYLSIIFFSFWEAVTSHSISKIDQSNSNIIWKIIEESNTNVDFENLLTLVKTLTSQQKVDDNTDITNFQSFLSTIAEDNGDREYFDTPFEKLIENMGKIQKYTDTFGILSIPVTSYNRNEDRKERKRIDDFYDNNKIVEDMYLSFMEVWTFMNVTMIHMLSLIKILYSSNESNDSKLKDEKSIIDVYNSIINQIKNEDNRKKPSTIASGSDTEDTLIEVFSSLHLSWIFFILIIIFCFFSQKNNDTAVEVTLGISTFFFLIALIISYISIRNKLQISSDLFDSNFHKTKMLTFLIFYVINSIIASFIYVIVDGGNNNKNNNDSDDDGNTGKKNGLKVLSDDVLKSRYGTISEIIMASIISLGFGWVVLSVMPKMINTDNIPASKPGTSS